MSTREVRRIKARVKSGPVNQTFLTAGLFGVAAWWLTGQTGHDPLVKAASWVLTFCFVVLTVSGTRLLAKDYRLRRDLALSEAATEDYGSARTASRAELNARGMNDAASGELYGFDEAGKAVFRPAKAPFALIEMPPGVGKTVNFVIGSILHRALSGYSVFVPDVKCELAAMLAPSLAQLGIEVWCINPAKRHFRLVGDVEVNLYQALIDAAYGTEEDRKSVTKYAGDYAAVHVPKNKDEKNPYFTYGSRRALMLAATSNALVDPSKATPTDAYLLLTDPSRFLKRCADLKTFRTAIKDDPLVEFLRVEGSNMLHRAQKNEENFASFLEGVTQKMLPFNPAGHLGFYGRNALHNIADLRKRQIVVFVMTPLDQLRELSEFVSLLNHAVLAACKALPGGHPVHIVGEEALNYRIDNLAGELEILRELRVSADFYIQSFDGLVRVYGREAAAAIESYADVRIYGGLNNYDRAKRVSDQLAEATVARQDASFGADVSEINLARREMARRLMTPDEVLAMRPGTAWMMARGLRPIHLALASYAEVAPWSGLIGNSPINGSRLRARTKLSIDYSRIRKAV